MSAEAQRLNRYLAACGLGSRRGVEALVTDGRVTIDDVVATSPGQRVPEGARVALDGRPVAPDEHAYVLLHKPADVVTTVRDTHGRRTVIDLVGADRRLFPIGRLDADTTGLLLLTNDGDLAARLMHPRHGVEKTYEATVVGAVSAETAARLAAGVELDGRRTAPARVRVLRASGRQSVVEIVLHEGRKRQVRRMCEAVGHHVLSLHRSAYAGPAPRHARAGRLAAAAPGRARAAAQRGGGVTWPRRASTAISRSPASARAAGVEGLVRAGRVSVDGVVALEPSAAVEPGAIVTLDGEPVVARGQAGVLVALAGGELPRPGPSERAAPGRDLAGRESRGAAQRRAAGPPPAGPRLRPGPPRRNAPGGGQLPPARRGRARRRARPGASGPASARTHA